MEGWRLRLLARGALADPLWSDLRPEVVPGDLEDASALDRLCDGARVVVHVAGVVKTRRAADFHSVNARGSGRIAAAARKAGLQAGFIAVSSLAAREPQLSAYAASKRAGEAAVAQALGDRAWIVRLPPLYGPEDRAEEAERRAACVSPVLPVLRPETRLAILHVEDAARVIAAMAARPGPGRIVALCDERPAGYGFDQIMTAVSDAVGRRPRVVRLPDAALHSLGLLGDLGVALGAKPLITSGKVREMLHPDWSVSQAEGASDLPRPRFDLQAGFAHTAAWYRQAGWLKSARR